MSSESLITFPPGVVGSGPSRMAILGQGPQWIALAKPADVGVTADPCEPDVPLLLDAIVAGIRAGRPQFAARGLGHVGRVHALDAQVTGAVVFATSLESESALRTAVGSRQWEFVYDLVIKDAPRDDTIRCDLPIARHRSAPRMVVSSATGRKSSTVFEPVERMGRYSLWEARTSENRLHQVRLHAAESGLRIPGERTYGRVPLVYLSAIKAHFRPGRQEERPLHGSIALHLREIRIGGRDGEHCVVQAPRPRSLSALLKRLRTADPL